VSPRQPDQALLLRTECVWSSWPQSLGIGNTNVPRSPHTPRSPVFRVIVTVFSVVTTLPAPFLVITLSSLFYSSLANCNGLLVQPMGNSARRGSRTAYHCFAILSVWLMFLRFCNPMQDRTLENKV
jgi:hypothetical protein